MTRALIDPEGREMTALEELGIDLTGLRVLDVGCGDGRVVWRIADQAASVVGVDPDADRIARARTAMPGRIAHKVQFRAASVADLDDPPAAFDLAFFTWSL